ncbi:MAG TPA: hypothetical protein VK509_15785 [Polyangiales bacterium]|nr:hypothetical protein [Polyangiales bacterium]
MAERTTACFLLVCCLLSAGAAQAQIKSPGAHESYSAELEPHLVVQWHDEPYWDDEGFGLGLRASFPVIDNGPITTINNSLAIGVGLDWAHFDDACDIYNINLNDDDCSANDFWVPVVLQWNFFFSKLVSAFPELGLAVQHSSWDVGICRRGNNNYYRCDDDDTDIELVLWLGVRFHVADNFAITLRLGTPSLLLGASFFL